jgi:phenylacetate-coenzyme A ligase PaaK-like adenylate-forming protein
VAYDLYSAFVTGVLFPLQEALKGHDTGRKLAALEESESWDPGRLERYQVERLRALLVRASERVPYYRELFSRTGFRPESVASLGDLASLPFLTKAEIRTHHDALIASGAKRLGRASTGGSTGEPLRFCVGVDRVTSDVAARRRAMRWWGLDVGDPEVVLWGSHIELTRQDRVRSIRDFLMRSTLLSANRMTPARMDHYLDEIVRVKPVQIFSHPSALAELARHAEERGRRMDVLGIRVAFLTAEQLYQHQRTRIERVFGCRVADGYGGRDSGFVAHQCPDGGMHLNAEDVIVEIVDDGRTVAPGRPGEIVVTNLASGDFPFIRYRTGDVGVRGESACRCGRGLPLLSEIHGRADDILVGLDGARVPGQVVVMVVRDVPGIRAFKIVQEAADLVRILLVISPDFSGGAEGGIAEGIRAHLGSAMRVELSVVEEIPVDPSGKYRTVVSRVGRSPTLDARRVPGGEGP